jgi:Uncharacterized conserved protein (DUF2203)
MKNAYNYIGAERLIPLIGTIHQEIRERSEAIRDINIRLHQLRNVLDAHGAADRRNARERELEELNLRADIASHKREIRFAKKELARLGCSLDQDNPFRVLIPGTDGEIENGYAWRVGDQRVQAFVQGGPTEAA